MDNHQIAVFASGCFWCTEAVFQRVRGVLKVESGYTGGEMDRPSYDQVSMGNTGHAEAIKLEFDPSVVSYRDLLEIFFATHDPTTANRQGSDVGTQYRSAIFYNSEEQEKEARQILEELEANETYQDPIVTEIKPLDKFFIAEGYHQNYYNQNQNQPYCQAVINPKLKKFKEKFASLLKEE